MWSDIPRLVVTAGGLLLIAGVLLFFFRTQALRRGDSGPHGTARRI